MRVVAVETDVFKLLADHSGYLCGGIAVMFALEKGVTGGAEAALAFRRNHILPVASVNAMAGCAFPLPDGFVGLFPTGLGNAAKEFGMTGAASSRHGRFEQFFPARTVSIVTEAALALLHRFMGKPPFFSFGIRHKIAVTLEADRGNGLPQHGRVFRRVGIVAIPAFAFQGCFMG